MNRILCALPFALLAGTMIAGCADDSVSGWQRPRLAMTTFIWDRRSLVNSIVTTNRRRLHNVIRIAGASLGTISRTP